MIDSPIVPRSAQQDSCLRRAPECLNIVVVDDNEDNAEILAEILRIMGHFVQTAPNGVTAIELLRRGPVPDAMFLDLTLPDMSGVEVARIARAMCGSKLRIVAVTGHSAEGHRRDAASAGCDLFLVKPYSLADIEASLSPLGEPR